MKTLKKRRIRKVYGIGFSNPPSDILNPALESRYYTETEIKCLPPHLQLRAKLNNQQMSKPPDHILPVNNDINEDKVGKWNCPSCLTRNVSYECIICSTKCPLSWTPINARLSFPNMEEEKKSKSAKVFNVLRDYEFKNPVEFINLTSKKEVSSKVKTIIDLGFSPSIISLG
jgi:hypothetical protein